MNVINTIFSTRRHGFKGNITSFKLDITKHMPTTE